VKDAEPTKRKNNHEKNKSQTGNAKQNLMQQPSVENFLESNRVSTSKHEKVICAKENRKRSTKENLISLHNRSKVA
jgi:hypothetical protein